MLRQTAEVSKAINPGAVSIRPTGLQCITTHEIESDKLEAFVRVAHMRTHNLTERIRLAAAVQVSETIRCRHSRQWPIRLRFAGYYSVQVALSSFKSRINTDRENPC